jgi:hypothetical protein
MYIYSYTMSAMSYIYCNGVVALSRSEKDTMNITQKFDDDDVVSLCAWADKVGPDQSSQGILCGRQRAATENIFIFVLTEH